MLLTFEDCILRENVVYFVAKEINMLCSITLKSGEVDVLGMIPEQELFKQRISGAIQCNGDVLIIAPNTGDGIWKYDLRKKEWKKLNIKEKGKRVGRVSQMVLYGNKIFLIGTTFPAIIVYDLESDTYDYIDVVHNITKNRVEELKEVYFFSNYVVKESYLYLASCANNMIIRFNMESYEVTTYYIGDDQSRLSGIMYDGNNYWIAPRTSGSLICWDGKKIIKKIDLLSQVVIRMGIIEDKIQIILLKEGEQEYSSLVLVNDGFEEDDLVFVKNFSEDNYIALTKNHKLKGSMVKGDISVEVDMEKILECYKNNEEYFAASEILKEGEIISLEDFIYLTTNI